MSRPKNSSRKSPLKNLRRQLHLEMLEERALPSCTSISGYVYYDANNNGLYDYNTETPIANSDIELRDANGVVVGTTKTDANGFYKFEQDQTHPTLASTLTKTVTFDKTQTNFSLTKGLDKFDPSLGQLESIEIKHAGSITSEIKVENFSNESQSDINGTVSGTLTLTAPGVNAPLNVSGSAGSFHASKYDGAIDFTGTSGKSFGEKTADNSDTITLTGAAMNAYVGTGQVQITEDAIATSTATGGGNLDVRVRSTAKSTVTVIYHYKAYDCLPPGQYKVIQTKQPDGFNDGQESKGVVVIPNTIGTDFINVTLDPNGDSINNNFGETKLSSIGGHVWFDANKNGVREVGELPIPGTTITLSGFDDQGPVSKTTTTDVANGEYKFTNLRPGSYSLTETQPAGYDDGNDVIGTPGGTTSNDQFTNIQLPAGYDGVNNDFGEIPNSPPPNETPLVKQQGLDGRLPFITKTQETLRGDTSNIPPELQAQMAFVVGAQVTLLNHQPDLIETSAAVQQLANGTSPLNYVQQLWATDTHRALQVTSAYADVLNRAPTAAEAATAIADLKAGKTEMALKETLYVSNDYQQAHPTSQALATALYQDILNVTPSSQTVQSLVQSMGNQTLQDVVHTMLTSDDAIKNQIDDVFRATVRRPASATDIQTWLPSIKAGTTTLDDLSQRLLGSQEFYQLTFNTIHY